MSPRNYGYVRSVAQLEKFVTRMITEDIPFGFDIESGYTGEARKKGAVHIDDPDWLLAGLSFTNSTEWARYVAVGHDNSPHNLDNREVAMLFWKLVNTGKGIAHNSKFELRGMRKWFLKHLSDVPEVVEANGYFPIYADSMLEAYVDASERKFALKDLVHTIYGHDQMELKELFEIVKERYPDLYKNEKFDNFRFNMMPLDTDVVNYACEDALWCLELHFLFSPRIFGKQRQILQIENLIVPLLCEMEDYGVLFDWAEMKLKAIEAAEFKEKLNTEIMTELTRMIGEPIDINLGSSPQLGDVLFTKLGFKSVKTTDTGKPSTDAVAVEALSQQYPIVKRIREWREMSKLIGSYLNKYERDFGYGADGMTHPSHNQVVVAAGRFSVSEPGYQQLPKKYHIMLDEARPYYEAHQAEHKEAGDDDCECDDPRFIPPAGTEFKLHFRSFVKAPKDHYILGWDFSQVELRVMAGIAKEPTLMAAFANDEDVHVATAAMMLGMPKDAVNKEDRAKGKTLNFGLAYQMGVKGLADRLGVSTERAQELMDEYFAAMPALKVWVQEIQKFGRQNDFVTTLFGRKVPIWEFGDSRKWIREKGERLCVNAPIQGTAADYMKLAMLKADKALKKAGLTDRVHMVMNIHDAIEFYVHESVNYEDVIRLLSPEVTFPMPDLPKIVADWHMGYDWHNLTEIKYENDEFKIKATKAEKYSPDNKEAVATHQTAAVFEKPDEDLTAEDVEALREYATPVAVRGPEIDSEPLAEVPEVTTPETFAVSRLVVQISAMPDMVHYERWLNLLDKNPGQHEVLLVTPDGSLDYENSGLTTEHQPQISLALGGASVAWEGNVEVSADSFDDIEI